MHGLEPRQLRRDVFNHGEPIEIPVRSHQSYACLITKKMSDKVWSVYHGDRLMVTLDGYAKTTTVHEGLSNGFCHGSARLTESICDLTGFMCTTNSNKYPFAPHLADGMPMFEGMQFTPDGHCLNPRPSIQVRKSRKKAVRGLYQELRDKIVVVDKLLGNNSGAERYPSLHENRITSHMAHLWLDNNKDKEVAVWHKTATCDYLEELTLDNFDELLPELVPALRVETYSYSTHYRSATRINLHNGSVDRLAGWLSGYHYISETTHELRGT